MAYYESIYIVRPDLNTEQLEQVTKRIADIITNNGGKIIQTELWGRRQLAFQVKKNSKGYYVFNLLEGGGALIANLETKLKIDEDILKFLNVRVDKADGGPTPLSVSEERIAKSPDVSLLDDGEVLEVVGYEDDEDDLSDDPSDL